MEEINERDRIVALIINAGKNKVSMLDPDKPRCETCLNGFTGTYWISQNDLIFAITGKYLSEYKEYIKNNDKSNPTPMC